MKEFISFSGGVESRTMALIYGGKADAIFADTGWEHQALYDQLDEVEIKIREWHGNDFKIIRIKAERGSLEDYINESNFYPSFQARFCTRMFKIEPIDNYLKQFEQDGATIMIGLNADEAGLRTGNHGLLPFVQYKYPLLDQGITRQMCVDMLSAAGILPNFPPYMQRGGVKDVISRAKRNTLQWLYSHRMNMMMWRIWRNQYKTNGGSSFMSFNQSPT